jgi:threonine dehydrogenase-like Zn-dependent dehydrogenase
MSSIGDCSVDFVSHEHAELVACEPDQEPLRPTEVAGRTLFSLISAGTELAGYQGHIDITHPGYAAVFEVEAVGSGVEDLRVGDRAFCIGPHRSFQRMEQDMAIPVPERLAPQSAVFARMMCVTMTTLVTTSARPPSLVLVTGLGLVGHLAARIFDLCGYDVIACDPSASRRAIAVEAGLRRVVSAVPTEDSQVAGQIALAVECSGHEQAVLDACAMVRKRGEVVLVGVPWTRKTDLSAHELLDIVFHKYAVLRSGWEWELPLHATDFRVGSIYGNLAGAMQWLADDRLAVDGLYTCTSPSDAQQAYQALLHNKAPRLGIMFDWATTG